MTNLVEIKLKQVYPEPWKSTFERAYPSFIGKDNVRQETIKIVQSDYLALESVLNVAGKTIVDYLSENGGIVEGGRVVKLYLGKSGMNPVPKEISLLTGLQELELQNNQIDALPESIGELRCLKFLDLSENQLTFLPETFGELSRLEILDLEWNQFTSLPGVIENLRELRYLLLFKNPITELPEYLSYLPNLTAVRIKKGIKIPLGLEMKVDYR